jgi:hypothetical protein
MISHMLKISLTPTLEQYNAAISCCKFHDQVRRSQPVRHCAYTVSVCVSSKTGHEGGQAARRSGRPSVYDRLRGFAPQGAWAIKIFELMISPRGGSIVPDEETFRHVLRVRACSYLSRWMEIAWLLLVVLANQ